MEKIFAFINEKRRQSWDASNLKKFIEFFSIINTGIPMFKSNARIRLVRFIEKKGNINIINILNNHIKENFYNENPFNNKSKIFIKIEKKQSIKSVKI
jgi:hypothetical protein